MRCLVTTLIAVALYGCASSSSVKNGVKVTRNAADVEHCKHIGAVQSVPPYSLPGEDMERIRNRALEVGADTVLLNTSRREAASGVAYRCSKS
jgi:outer membrane lipoprotein SlyB